MCKLIDKNHKWVVTIRKRYYTSDKRFLFIMYFTKETSIFRFSIEHRCQTKHILPEKENFVARFYIFEQISAELSKLC